MKHARNLVLAFATIAAAASIGCGSSDETCGDAGCPDSAASTTDGPKLWGLSRGTNGFKITAVSGVTDGCMKGVSDLATLNTVPFPVTYTEATTIVSIGDLKGTPAQPSLGSGPVAGGMATLVRDNRTGDATAACVWSQKDTGQFTLIGDDMFTLTVTETQSMFTAGCTDVPAGGTCTSTWTWTMAKAP